MTNELNSSSISFFQSCSANEEGKETCLSRMERSGWIGRRDGWVGSLDGVSSAAFLLGDRNGLGVTQLERSSPPSFPFSLLANEPASFENLYFMGGRFGKILILHLSCHKKSENLTCLPVSNVSPSPASQKSLSPQTRPRSPRSTPSSQTSLSTCSHRKRLWRRGTTRGMGWRRGGFLS